MYSFKEISPNRKLGLKGLKNGKYVMSLTSIYGRGPWKFTDSSTSRHGEVTAIVLVDQEVWGWIWYLFLQHNHQRRTPYKLVKINLNNITISNEPLFSGIKFVSSSCTRRLWEGEKKEWPRWNWLAEGRSKPRMFTGKRLVQWPHLTVTVLNKLVQGTLT